jgi:hypothetical protein
VRKAKTRRFSSVMLPFLRWRNHDKFDGKLQCPQTAYLSRKQKMHGRYGRLSPLLFLYAYYYLRSFSLSFVEVLKKAAIPAIVLCSPHKQAKNSMAGCCNNLP